MRAEDDAWLEQFYDAYPRIEEAFQHALNESLEPRGPGMLLDLVSDLGLVPGARVVDVGCGEGRDAIALARRFGFTVVGVDPLARHLELARQALAKTVEDEPALAGRVRFDAGRAEALPLPDDDRDLVWCCEVLVHVRTLDRAGAELHRVLRPGGRALVSQVFATDRLLPGEHLHVPGTVGEGAETQRVEAALTDAGLRIDECVALGSEWGEYAEERAGQGTRRLLHAARLLRAPDRYVERFGRAAYEIMLGDCLWHVHRMIGKLSGRVYLLSRAS